MIKRLLIAAFIAISGIYIGLPQIFAQASKQTGTSTLFSAHDANTITTFLSKGRNKPAATPNATDPDELTWSPVYAENNPGTFHVQLFVSVDNIDSDPYKEFCAWPTAVGPLYCWNHDGTPVIGWPPPELPGSTYATFGNFSSFYGGNEIFLGYYGANHEERAGNAAILWQKPNGNYISTAGSVASASGQDVVFVGEEDWKLHAYKPDGTELAGWPFTTGWSNREVHTPAIADIDPAYPGEETLFTTGIDANKVMKLFALHQDATPVSGWPIEITSVSDNTPVVGDIDGDGQTEIVVIVARDAYNSAGIYIYSPNGMLKNSRDLDGYFYGSTYPALFRVENQSYLTIAIELAWGKTFLLRGDTLADLPGWPVTPPATQSWCTGAGSTVVGDIDGANDTGDSNPEIVFTTMICGSGMDGALWAYKLDGTLHPSFPKYLPLGFGSTPAIDDIDGDGRNELLLMSSFWNGYPGSYPWVWGYRIGGGGGNGPSQWPQFCRDGQHTCRYEEASAPTPIPSPSPTLSPTPTISPTPTPTNQPPVITTKSLPVGYIGKTYSATVQGYDPNPSDTLTMTMSNLPPGLTQRTCKQQEQGGKKVITCPIKGTPAAIGPYSVYIRLYDQTGNETMKTLKLSIKNPTPTPATAVKP